MEKLTLKFSGKRFLFLGFFTIILAGCGSSNTYHSDNQLKGEILELADPTIFYKDGLYYLYGTGSPNGFKVYTSKDLQVWEGPHGATDGFALKKGNAFGARGFWAPQIFEYQNKFYMAYTANESIAIASSDSPLGPFVQKKKEALKAPVRQIDPFVFIDEDNKKYLYHVRVADGGNRIFVAEMKDDLSGIKEETLTECIQATETWENIENDKWSVTEGPSVLKRGEKYYLVYTANHWKRPDYAVGYAVSDNPYGPWKKYEGNPILRREHVNQNGTGHGDFFRDKKGELKYVFHTHKSETEEAPRKTAIINIGFSENKKRNGMGSDVLELDQNSFYFLRK